MDQSSHKTSCAPPVKLFTHTVVMSAFLAVWCSDRRATALLANTQNPSASVPVFCSSSWCHSSHHHASLHCQSVSGSLGRMDWLALAAASPAPDLFALLGAQRHCSGDSQHGWQDHWSNYGSKSTAPALLLAKFFNSRARKWVLTVRTFWIRKDRSTHRCDSIFYLIMWFCFCHFHCCVIIIINDVCK